MSEFSFSRFKRVIQNDALRIARPLAYGTLAVLGLTVLIYLTNFHTGEMVYQTMNPVFFGIYLLGGGLLFTSLGFQDMHHPLERYQYLMLPCSNIERFLSRYLLTGPLYLLYVILAFSGIDWLGNQLTAWWIGARQPLFSPFTALSLLLIRIYLLAHIVMLTGAICFRSHALIKTALSLLLLLVGFVAAMYVLLRIFYWDAFSWTSFHFHVVKPLQVPLLPLFDAAWMNFAVAGGFALWILYVAYRCLRAHEVQDGL